MSLQILHPRHLALAVRLTMLTKGDCLLHIWKHMVWERHTMSLLVGTGVVPAIRYELTFFCTENFTMIHCSVLAKGVLSLKPESHSFHLPQSSTLSRARLPDLPLTSTTKERNPRHAPHQQRHSPNQPTGACGHQPLKSRVVRVPQGNKAAEAP